MRRRGGALFFGAAHRFLLELTDVTDVEVMILRLGRLRVLDSTGAQALAASSLTSSAGASRFC